MCDIIGNGGQKLKLTTRPFKSTDAESIVEILKKNRQYDYPDIEGPEAMSRVAECPAAVFLVAEINPKVAGCVRATYDGSRAMIHLLSVLPELQNRGIGTSLVKAVVSVLSSRGAPTVSVTVTDASEVFWSKLGFDKLPVFLMLRETKF
jgi:N-acetylglutamate synthase-like GNAT family acetyltransferase